MKSTDTKLKDVKNFEPTVVEDERDFLFESFNHKKLEEEMGRKIIVVRDNHSKSSNRVLHALHYQIRMHAQVKVVRLVQDEMFGFTVDFCKSSPTYEQWVAEKLSDENEKQLSIPQGLAHVFLTLSDPSELLTKLTEYYSVEANHCNQWDGTPLAIKWPAINQSTLTAKGAVGKAFTETDLFSNA